MTVETSLGRLPRLQAELQLSSSEAFRLFAEGAQALLDYERTAENKFLSRAQQRMSLCVQKYPSDILPRFYLAVIKSLLHDERDEAIAFFLSAQQSANELVRRPAKYNLAASYIDTYTDENLHKAEEILSGLERELSSSKADRKSTWRQAIVAFFKPSPPVPEDELLFQTRAALLYVRVHALWVQRSAPAAQFAQLATDARELKGQLEGFLREFNRAGGQQIPSADAILAWHWNNMGTFEESLAGICRSEQPDSSREHAVRAAAYYEKALTFKSNWPATKANLARLYWERLDRYDRAIDIFTELVRGVEEVDYSYYNLGRIYEERGDKQALEHEPSNAIKALQARRADDEKALESYAQAPLIPGAQYRRARILHRLGQTREAKRVLKQVIKDHPTSRIRPDAEKLLQEISSR